MLGEGGVRGEGGRADILWGVMVSGERVTGMGNR